MHRPSRLVIWAALAAGLGLSGCNAPYVARENLEWSKAFMASNRRAPEIRAAASGIQYRVLSSGYGPSARGKPQVLVHYELIRAIDYRIIDSTFERSLPVEVKLADMPEFWRLAVELMREGDDWLIFAPPELAYGERGRPPAIGPNEVVILHLKLLVVPE